jgi:hypothetical protein
MQRVMDASTDMPTVRYYLNVTIKPGHAYKKPDTCAQDMYHVPYKTTTTCNLSLTQPGSPLSKAECTPDP